MNVGRIFASILAKGGVDSQEHVLFDARRSMAPGFLRLSSDGSQACCNELDSYYGTCLRSTSSSGLGQVQVSLHGCFRPFDGQYTLSKIPLASVRYMSLS